MVGSHRHINVFHSGSRERPSLPKEILREIVGLDGNLKCNRLLTSTRVASRELAGKEGRGSVGHLAVTATQVFRPADSWTVDTELSVESGQNVNST